MRRPSAGQRSASLSTEQPTFAPRPTSHSRPATAAGELSNLSNADLSRFGNRRSFFGRSALATVPATPLGEAEEQGAVCCSPNIGFARPMSALSRTTRDINASVSDVWSIVGAKDGERVTRGDSLDGFPLNDTRETEKLSQPPGRSVRRCSSAATWQRLSRRGNNSALTEDRTTQSIVMPLERVRQLQCDAEERKRFMKQVSESREAARQQASVARVSASPIKTNEPEISLSGDATLTALSAAASFFQRATDVRNVAEKRERERGVFSRQQQSLCTKLLRTVEDLERPNEVQALRVKLTEIDIRRNSWKVMTVLAVVGAEMHSRFLRELGQVSSRRAAQLNSSSAASAFRAICAKRTQWLMQRTGKFIWRMWMLFRPRIRRRRKTRSIDLIRQFFGAIQQTTRVVVAISHLLKTVRRVQSHVKSGRAMRAVRSDMAHRQVLRGIGVSQAADVARIDHLKSEFEKREAEILAKKTGTRVTKSVKIAELRADLDQEVSRLKRRSSEQNIDLLMKNEKVLLSVVDAAVAKRLSEYGKQLSRYARAVVAYIEEMNDLRRRGIVPPKFRRQRFSPAQELLARSMRTKDSMNKSAINARPLQKEVPIPQPPIRPFFHSLFSFDEIQQHIEDTLDQLGVP